MKIVYCLNSIRGLGGIQKITLIKANALAEIAGNEVYVIVTDNWEKHVLTQEISPKVHFINLGVNYYKDDYKSGLHQIKSNLRIFRHYFCLQKQINQIKPDVIISVGQGEKYIIPWLRTKAVKIREIHFNSTYRHYTYSKKWIARLLDIVDYKLNVHGYDKIVLLTKEDKETNFPDNDKFTYVHNPLTFVPQSSYSACRERTVVAVGRLELQKDFASLIRAWQFVHQTAPDWKLNIWGEGSRRPYLTNWIKELGLEDCVFLRGYTKDVHAKLEESSVFVLSSLFEGLPLVILEAMGCGLPVVSFTCPFGPRDIIQEGVSGFLVENRNEIDLANRIVRLICSEDLRNRMGRAALMRTKDFDISIIVLRWMNLFKEEIAKK
ncbi:glycosyltransferase family 4 protein [Bacteroides caecicola]|uniref:Glycosyltransferase family 4 protein n=1 Tax=Bacteroides caecicola TaxID=1462569 RepID=A0ABS2FAJ3_9BACE|nr:glycosyltransferase family 4 protein [Bacteroides caecicola]MBM6807295.1 glycosyltransferase family 4 protein [Bacteroides caecicola]